MSNDGRVTWKDGLIALLALVLALVIVAIIANDEPSKPVKDNTINVDSLLTTNDSIKLVITYIDSVKNEEIQQVLKLDNDSTVELFKQLVRE